MTRTLRNTRRWSRLLGVLALAAMLIFAAACDDSEDGDGGVIEDGDTPTATETPEETPTETETPEETPTETETPEDGTATATGTAAGGGGEAGGTVEATLSDFAVELGQDTIPAGETTFEVTNEGATAHNFYVIQTDMAPDSLPVDGAQVALDQFEVPIESDDIPSGETTEVSGELEAGPYVVICNIPGHYALGMYTGLTVE